VSEVHSDALVIKLKFMNWAHPASYPMGTGASFSGSKAARTWSCPLTPSWCRNLNNVLSYTSTLPVVLMTCCLVKLWIRLQGVVLS